MFEFKGCGENGFTYVTNLIGVSPVLMLCPVRRIAEGLLASGELAGVRLLSRVGPQVSLQVLQPGVSFGARFKLQKKRKICIVSL